MLLNLLQDCEVELSVGRKFDGDPKEMTFLTYIKSILILYSGCVIRCPSDIFDCFYGEIDTILIDYSDSMIVLDPDIIVVYQGDGRFDSEIIIDFLEEK